MPANTMCSSYVYSCTFFNAHLTKITNFSSVPKLFIRINLWTKLVFTWSFYVDFQKTEICWEFSTLWVNIEYKQNTQLTLQWQTNITLFRSITIFCGADNIPCILYEYGEYSLEYHRSCITLLWIWIMLWSWCGTCWHCALHPTIHQQSQMDSRKYNPPVNASPCHHHVDGLCDNAMHYLCGYPP